MIDIRKLKELVRLMVANELTELDLRDSEEQVTLRRQSPGFASHASAGSPSVESAPAPVVTASVPAETTPVEAAPEVESGMTITSPMVGTYYSAQNPDSPPFADVGSLVGADTTICIIEAMKIFNEIKAECSGTITKVLVSNGESVEFGQPLFLVKPS